MGASGVGSKVWVLTIGVLEVNPELDSVRAQRGRARSALFSRVKLLLENKLFMGDNSLAQGFRKLMQPKGKIYEHP